MRERRISRVFALYSKRIRRARALTVQGMNTLALQLMGQLLGTKKIVLPEDDVVIACAIFMLPDANMSFLIPSIPEPFHEPALVHKGDL